MTVSSYIIQQSKWNPTHYSTVRQVQPFSQDKNNYSRHQDRKQWFIRSPFLGNFLVFSVGFSGGDKNLSAALSLDYFQFLPEDENPQTSGSVFSFALEQKKTTTTTLIGRMYGKCRVNQWRHPHFFYVPLRLDNLYGRYISIYKRVSKKSVTLLNLSRGGNFFFIGFKALHRRRGWFHSVRPCYVNIDGENVSYNGNTALWIMLLRRASWKIEGVKQPNKLFR